MASRRDRLKHGAFDLSRRVAASARISSPEGAIVSVTNALNSRDVHVEPMGYQMVAYLDGCPDDTLGREDRWHTYALVFPTLASMDCTDFNRQDSLAHVGNALRRTGFALKPWKERKRKRGRRRLAAALATAASSTPFAIIAASFLESHARAHLPGLLENMELAGLVTHLTRNDKSKFRVGPFIRNGTSDFCLEVTEDQLCVLLTIIEVLAGTWDFCPPCPDDLPGEPSWVVYSDELAGDTRAAPLRAEFIEHALRRTGRNIRFVPAARRRRHAGDMLADNVAGFLNGWLESATSPLHHVAAADIVTLARSFPRGAGFFQWSTFGSMIDLVDVAKRRAAGESVALLPHERFPRESARTGGEPARLGESGSGDSGPM